MFRYPVDDDISLALLTLKDTEALYAITDTSRDYLREWLPWVDAAQSPDVTATFIAAGLKQWADNRGFQAGIWHRGSLVGCIGLHGIDWSNRFTAMGYWLSRRHQGQGIMTRSVKGALDFVFYEYDLNRVEIRAALGNIKSRAIPERLGFIHERTVRQAEWIHDHYVDHALYGLLREEWHQPGEDHSTSQETSFLVGEVKTPIDRNPRPRNIGGRF